MGQTGVCWQMIGGGKPLQREILEPPGPGRGEVTVRIAGCGVCHTDLGFLHDGVRPNHPLPLTLGHEISGKVVGAGPEAEKWLGHAVIIPSVIPCGECDLCRRGLANVCRQQKMPGNDIQGGFATHINVPAFGLCRVDEQRLSACGMELAEVAVVADAVTTPYQAAVLAGLAAGDVAIVVGVGGVGTYAVQIAAALGATVVAIDVDDEKLQKISGYGAALTINARTVDGPAIRKRVQGFARDRQLRATEWKIFECSGTPAGQVTAFSLLNFGAHLAIVGFTLAKAELRLSNLMAYHARMQGNWGCAPDLYPAALDLVLSGRVKMKPFISLQPLAEVNRVLAAAQSHALGERAILVP
ncbi:MAG: 6-hydroxycyclohex-1-ene-1-carbonyl-CoA dehydrogenase [Gammaproteobacteria bacterium]|nr:6-hydroxycyclohex-1-ene-1-carbonyl-CoA dehydrogenase [Gammaproteobacteria bacterium]